MITIVFRTASLAIALVAAAAPWSTTSAYAQGHQHAHAHQQPTVPASSDPSATARPAPPPSQPPAPVPAHAHTTGSVDPAGGFFMQQSSGTSAQPSGWAMPMRMHTRAGWDFAVMGQIFVVSTLQSGPRGRDDAYSANWVMASASRRLGAGRLQLRLMSSLEPATVPGRRYPLLFQTGERADGRPIVDGQHPHEFVMEASVQYAVPLGRAGLAYAYYAPVGDAALGPVAFPHRASAMELPQATLGHHWQDATHIANNVATLGWATRAVRLEGSAFHGSEPDEHRWDIDAGPMNSWSARASLSPSPAWMGQVSFGRITRPESHHPDDVERATASLHHVGSGAAGRQVATSVMWASNRKTVARSRTHAITVESLAPVSRRGLVTGRFEWSQRDELFEYDHDLADRLASETGRRAFDVTAMTVGYTHRIALTTAADVGVGANVTRYWIDDALRPFYGRSPWGLAVFMRARLR